MDVLYNVLPVVLEITLPVLTLLIAYGVRALVKKWGAEEKINVDKLTDQIVSRVVDGVEQISDAAKKAGESGSSGESKLSQATNRIIAEMQKLNLPETTGQILRMKIEAYLRGKKKEEVYYG